MLVLVFLTASCAVIAELALSSDGITENSWTTLAPMSTPRTGLDAAVVDGKIYAIGGTSSKNEEYASNKNEEYDPATNTWTTRAAVPTGRHNLATVTVQNKIYAIGGNADEYPPIPLAKNEVYDPYTNTWATKAEMPTARSQMCANNVNGQIYVIGGLKPVGPNNVEPSNKTEVYNPTTNTWTTKAEMLHAAVEYSSVVLSDKIYVLTSPIQIYDTKTDSWSLGSLLPINQSSADAVTILDERGRELIYIFGGLVQIYDPKNDIWGVGSPMPTPRYGLAVAVVNNQIYALGGVTSGGPYGTLVSTNERYTPLESDSPLPTPTPAPTSSHIHEPEPFPTTLLIAASGLSVAVIGIGLLLYFKKRKSWCL
jgi:hypothetical protein